MISIVDGAVNVSISGSRETLLKIQDHFKWRPNRFYMDPRYIIWKKTMERELAEGRPLSNVGWDGWKRPGKLLKSGKLVMGRGWTPLIVDLAEIEGWPVDLSGMIENPFKDLQPDEIPDEVIAGSRHLEQWELQKNCVAALMRAGCGRVKVTVSGGKTAILCSVAALIKAYRPEKRILYITPNERLVSQSSVEARKFLPHWDVGQYGGAERQLDAKDLVVATSAILNTNLEKLVKAKWFDSFAGILCDECQFSASKSQQKILTACRAWFRVGVSDTTKEGDPYKNAILTGSFGPVLNETIEAGDLIEMGQIAKPTIRVVKFQSHTGVYNELNHMPEEGSPGWALSDGKWINGNYAGPAYELNKDGDFQLDKAGNPVAIPGTCYFEDKDGNVQLMETKWCLLERKFDRSIIRFKPRNEYIQQRCLEWQQAGLRTLVIVTRTVHVKLLEAELSKVCDMSKVRILYGVHTLKERDEAFSWIKETAGAVLVSPLVKIGTSINEIERGIVADFVADHELANQFVGRFIRKKFKGSNTAEIIWFHDVQHRSYGAVSNKVIRYLKSIDGYEFDEDII